MRIIREVNLPACKITFFSWNNRFIIKLEQGLLEQTFKVDQSAIAGEEALLAMIDDEFMRQASERFMEMGRSLQEAMRRSD